MLKTIALLTLLVVARSGSDEADIERTFERYRKALEQGNGKTAYAQIDSQSQAYYEEILDKTKFATPAECAGFTALEKLSVLLGRVQIATDTLAALDGDDYFRYAVEQGWVSQIGDETVSIEGIDIVGNEALVYIRRGDEISPFPHVFKKEGTDWKLSLVEMLPVGEEAMQKHLDRIGVQEQDFLFDAVEAAVGIRPTEQTWEAPLRRDD